MLRVIREALATLYGLCALAVFCLMFVLAALLAVIVPRLRWRRALTHQLARAAVVLFRLRLSTTGLDRLPSGSCVVVANHESYLDGVLLKAVLPPRFSFVIKREAASLPVAGFLLRRIGSVFVDRNTRGGRQRDARRVLEHAELGHSLVFFPEGTFDETVGLKRFHVGAFTAAVRGAMPLVPIVIRGSRLAMPSHALIPRAGRIDVELLDPLPAAGPDISADRLRDDARRRMLARLDVPDLEAGSPASPLDVDASRNPM